MTIINSKFNLGEYAYLPHSSDEHQRLKNCNSCLNTGVLLGLNGKRFNCPDCLGPYRAYYIVLKSTIEEIHITFGGISYDFAHYRAVESSVFKTKKECEARVKELNLAQGWNDENKPFIKWKT